MRWIWITVVMASWHCSTHSDAIAATEAELEKAREILKNGNIKTDDASLLHFFQKREIKVDPSQINKLVANLGSRSFRLREKATKTLADLGASSVPALLRAQRSNDLEVRRRASECLVTIDRESKPRLVIAAAKLIAHQKPEGAVEALLKSLPTILGEDAIEEIHNALVALARSNGKSTPAFLKGLESPLAAQRAGAAVALCRAGIKDHRDKIRPLLKDQDPLTRLYVGLSLAELYEKDAIPVLIGLCSELPRNKLWKVEDVLYSIAEEKAPGVVFGKTEKSAKDFREAWMAWWNQHGEKLDLSKRLKSSGPKGNTVVVLLDEGKVLDLDKNNKPRFTVDKVGFPLDVDLLPGDRLLLAEHGANQVTERHRNGNILWKYSVTEPLVAQRLENGSTFIGAKEQLLIVNRSGKVLFSYARPNSESFMRARRLPNGDIVCVTTYSRFFRLDPTGKQLQSFNVNVSTSGGRIDVLKNGNVLIPEMYDNRVVEYTPQGRMVRSINVNQPIVASHLPNGNILVTCMEEKRAVELAPRKSGTGYKEVWTYRATTRVTRAIRR